MLILIIALIAMGLVVHEMGHWALLYRYGIPVTNFGVGLGPTLISFGKVRINLFPIGGCIVPDKQAYARLDPAKKALVALFGPLFSFLYGFCLYFGALGQPQLYHLAQLNFALAFINLMPIPPLDGWAFIVALQEWRNKPMPVQVLKFSQRVGSGLIYGVGFLALFLLII